MRRNGFLLTSVFMASSILVGIVLDYFHLYPFGTAYGIVVVLLSVGAAQLIVRRHNEHV